jgi:hypothetical protein
MDDTLQSEQLSINFLLETVASSDAKARRTNASRNTMGKTLDAAPTTQ